MTEGSLRQQKFRCKLSLDMTESEISRRSREAISKLGIPVERVNASGYRSRSMGATPGTPDCWTALGWIEFKRPGCKLRPEQEAWHRRAKVWGVRVAVSHSVEETVSIVREWLGEREHAIAMGWEP